MTNYPNEGAAPYEGTPGSTGAPYQGGGGATAAENTGHYPPTGPPPPWQGQQGYQGQPTQQHQQPQQHSGFGGFGGSSGNSRSGRSLNVRSTFKTTEFWVLIVVSLALLIAAAVTDRGDDNQGFGTQDAWRYVTALAIAYIISRGLTKFGGHERDDDHHDRH